MSSSPNTIPPTPTSPILLAAIKGTSIVLLIVVSIGLGLAPLKIKGFTSNQRLLGYINSFSAGLFLGMGLLHLLCGSLQDYSEYMEVEKGAETYYPVPVLVAIASFSLILLFEKVVFAQHELIHAVVEEDVEALENKSLPGVITEKRTVTEPLLVASRELSLVCNPETEEENFKKMLDMKEKLARTTLGMRLRSLEQIKRISSTAAIPVPVSKEPSIQAPLKLVSEESPSKHAHSVDQEHEHEHEHDHHHAVGPISILIALSIHGMFEGIAVGIQNTSGAVINLVIAVLLHKWAEALTLGVALFKANIPKQTIIYQIIVFSLAGPAGIAIGWILTRASLLVSAIFKAIPAGTFLYVATAELIVEEFSISKQVKRKFLCYMAGIIMMGLILLLDE